MIDSYSNISGSSLVQRSPAMLAVAGTFARSENRDTLCVGRTAQFSRGDCAAFCGLKAAPHHIDPIGVALLLSRPIIHQHRFCLSGSVASSCNRPSDRSCRYFASTEMTRKNSKVFEQERFDILDRHLPKHADAIDCILRVRRVEWSFAVRCKKGPSRSRSKSDPVALPLREHAPFLIAAWLAQPKTSSLGRPRAQVGRASQKTSARRGTPASQAYPEGKRAPVQQPSDYEWISRVRPAWPTCRGWFRTPVFVLMRAGVGQVIRRARPHRYSVFPEARSRTRAIHYDGRARAADAGRAPYKSAKEAILWQGRLVFCAEPWVWCGDGKP